MRRILERKFEGMSPRERRKEVLRMQRIEREARRLLNGLGVDVNEVREKARESHGTGGFYFISNARIRDLADALGMYDAPTDVAKSKAN